jgi:hypothetical protein
MGVTAATLGATAVIVPTRWLLRNSGVQRYRMSP